MSLTKLIPLQYRLPAIGLLIATLASVSAAAAWQAQNWRYGQQLERQARLHGDTLNEITLASAALQRSEQGKRLQVEQQLQREDKTHYQERIDAKQTQLVCVIVSLLLTCGCQSSSTRPMPTASAECLPPPAPAAWFMAPQEPNLTHRMLDELSASPTTATKD